MKPTPGGQPFTEHLFPARPLRAFGPAVGRGVIRARPEDFQVEEIPPCAPDGAGEHILLRIEKRGSNTTWVARQLAQLAGVPQRDVSYAGLKDRHALTRQWFSVRLAGRPEPDWKALESDDLRVLESARHGRKLRRGALRGNRFRIRVRELAGDRDALERRLMQIQANGIPNYFGEQRFGHGGGNLRAARDLFNGTLGRVGRQRRGLYISAARSLLFNLVLAHRVEAGNWNRILEGEQVALDGSTRRFHAQRPDDELLVRLRAMDIHPSGPLWGRGDAGVSGEAAKVESEALSAFGDWKEGLEHCGAEMDRRALRAPVRELEWEIRGDRLLLCFTLPRGSYATVLLGQCLDCSAGPIADP